MSNELSRAGNGEVDLSGTAASGTSTEIGTFTIGGGEVAMNLGYEARFMATGSGGNDDGSVAYESLSVQVPSS
jgi:hypothetical protein